MAEINRYKLWLDQKYRSPYTGEVIPLTKLFTSEYEIEHVIPQSRYFDDSFSNKVICEASVNKLKDNQLGLEFIKNHHGEKVECGQGKTVEIFSESAYKNFIQEHYSQGKSRSKRNKLLMEEVPDKMIERQLNDTRYISKFISNVLSNIVRADKGDDGINSKNIIPGNGKITGKLKEDWGLNDVWNSLILPRFERMNKLTNSEDFTSINTSGKTISTVPMKLSKGFQKKRIDHRHHALDALIIACATRDHVQYLNNENAKSQKFHLQRGLARKLRRFESVEISKMKKNDKGVWAKCEEKINKEVPKDFLKPWNTITEDTRSELEKVVVSFKQNLRVINKTTNRYESYKDENGNLRIGKDGKPKKDFISQTKGDSWAIRKPMHKETVSGKVDLPRIKVPKGKTLTATRKSIDMSYNSKTIESITDTGIQKILNNYLLNKENNPELAFSPEGLDDMNKNIEKYNKGKRHQPIFKVRIFEAGNKFPLIDDGNKKDKYVEAAKGTNLFFAVYERKDTKARMFDTVPLNEVIEHQKLQSSENKSRENRTDIPIKKTLEFKGKEIEVNYLFHLSPNELVYVPTEDELANNAGIDFSNLTKVQKNRIYKFTDGSGVMANFIPATISEVLFNMNKEKQKKAGIDLPIQNEIGVGSQGSKNERAISGEQIKSVCIKLKVDRLGNISKA